MFCHECGTKNEEDALFCSECGTPLKETNWNVQFSKTRKPVSKISIVMIIEWIIAIGLIAGIFIIIGEKCSPETVAMKHWEAVAAGEWADVYETCDFPENEFLTKQMYLNANANSTDIISYKTADLIDLNAPVNAANKTDAKEYRIEYLVKGNDEKDYRYVVLTRTGQKQFLFWDEWKVSSFKCWAEDVQFSIPVNATMTLNGMEIPEELVTGSDEEGKKNVVIPYLFTGTYQLEVTAEEMEPYRKVVDVYTNGCDIAEIHLYPSQDTVQMLAKQAGKDIKLILESALEEKQFNEIKSCFSEPFIKDGHGAEGYNYLKGIKGNGEDSGILSLNLKNIRVSPKMVSERYIYLRLKADLRTTYRRYGYDIPGENAKELNIELVYTLNADGWKLADFPLSYSDIYYITN